MIVRIEKKDALEGLKELEDNSIDIIITSPPYNKMGLNGNQKGVKWVGTIDYGNDKNLDNKPEEEYQQWQIDILNECYRVLKNDGVMFYNHKNRIVKGEGYIISPLEWLYKTKFLIRQEIIWSRGGSPNVYPDRYVPSYETIYFLTKEKNNIFKRVKTVEFKTDVWRIAPDKNTEHPAPFPLAIPDNILKCINVERNITVLDPFSGSGTVALSAYNNGYDFIGFDIVEEYVEYSKQRLRVVN